jgi:hypothetical protein
MTETAKQQRQQRWLSQHSLTWTQRRKIIESKLERARLQSQALQRREAVLHRSR